MIGWRVVWNLEVNKNLRWSQFHGFSKSFTCIFEIISNRQNNFRSNKKWTVMSQSVSSKDWRICANRRLQNQKVNGIWSLVFEPWPYKIDRTAIFIPEGSRCCKWQTSLGQDRPLFIVRWSTQISEILLTRCWYFIVVIWTCVAEDGNKVTWR